MAFELDENEKRLYELLMQVPPDLQHVRSELAIGKYPSESLSRVALEFVEECFDETMKHGWNEEDEYDYHSSPAVLIEGEHSTYLYQVFEMLLEYGLDPNAVIDGKNVLCDLRYIENEYVAADTTGLMLAHGGNINLTVDGDSVFDEIDFGVIFDAIEQYDRRRYDSLVHCWFVWLGYGAAPSNGTAPVDLFKDHNTGDTFDIRKLKNHRNYTFALTHVPGRGNSWSLHIIDKQSMWEVARL